MLVAIAGCTIALPTAMSVPPALAAFATSPASPDLSIDLAPALQPPAGRRVFQADQLWELWHAEHTYQFVLHDHVRARQAASLTWEAGWPRQAQLGLAAGLTARDVLVEYPLLQLLLMEYLADHGGAVLHACGVISEGLGLAFAGPPGAGKSTTARLWHAAGVQVLSDDRVALRAGSPPQLLGTPWHSTTPHTSPASAPLKALLLLRHGPENRLTPLSGTAALQRLLPEVHLPLWSAAAVTQTLATLDEILTQVACYDLTFVPDQTAVAYVQHYFAS